MATVRRLLVHDKSGPPLPPVTTLDFNDNTFVAAYFFIKNFIGVDCSTSLIDAKIDQAMDLVKEQLMYEIREEVEVLQKRITGLLEQITQLESENSFLKSKASPEALCALGAAAQSCRHPQPDDAMKSEDFEVAQITASAHSQV